MSLSCRPALQAWAGSQQLGNRSRKGTSFLSRAGNLGQERKGEERSKGRSMCRSLSGASLGDQSGSS